MAASIVLTGLSANDPVPGTYLEILFAQGASAGFGGTRPALLIGNKTTAGTATPDTQIYGPDTPVPCQSEQDVINLFGAGSELHRGFRRFVKVNDQQTSVYFLPVTESVGAAATMTFVLAGGAPTTNGNWRVWPAAEVPSDYGFVANDTLASMTAGMAAVINGRTDLPVIATTSTTTTTGDTLVLTAKQRGPRGNWLRGMAAIVGASGTATVNTTVTNTVDAFFTGGTTPDSNAIALTTIAARRFGYVVSAAEDSAQFGALLTQINAQAQPTVGIRQRAFAGSIDTVGNGNTVATTINAARAEITWSKRSPWTPFELACNAAAVYAKYELGDKPRFNFSGFGNDAATQADWRVPQSRDPASKPTRSDIKAALLNGLTPVDWNTNGTTYLVKRVTTRSLNGTNPDYRIRDAHKVTVCDWFADALYQKTVDQFSGKNLGNDVPQGQRPPPNDTTTPNRYRDAVLQLINDFGDDGWFQNVDAIKAGTIVQRETNPPSRVSASIPLQPIDIADQFAIQILQVA